VVLAGPSAASPTPAGTTSASPSATATPGTPSPDATGSPAPGGSASPTPSEGASATPTAAPTAPAEIQIPAAGFVVLNRTSGRFLQLVGLGAELLPGQSIPMTFDFGGTRVEIGAPVAVPLSPAPVSTPINEEGGGGHEG
jgi:hypothetical protein